MGLGENFCFLSAPTTFMNNRNNYGAVLTVSNLLNLRAYSPSLANNFTVFDTVNSSIGYYEF